jgi:hypothetical protein
VAEEQQARSGREGPNAAGGEEGRAQVRTCLLADLGRYTPYTVEHGDAAAVKLASRSEWIARDVGPAHDGGVRHGGGSGFGHLRLGSGNPGLAEPALPTAHARRSQERQQRRLRQALGWTRNGRDD